MDPLTGLGLVSCLDQLASAASNIVANMYRYYAAVRDAPKHSEELRREMGALSDLLKDLVEAVSCISTHSTHKVPDSFNTSVKEMLETLDGINRRVHPSETLGYKRLKWPFTQKENERLLSKLQRYSTILSGTLDINTA